MAIQLTHIGIAALLLFAALLQGNDPDPAYWVLLYGGASVLAAAGALRRAYPTAALLLCGAALAGVVQSLAGFGDYLLSGAWTSLGETMNTQQPWIEPAREFLGAGLVAIIALIYRRGDQKV